MAYNLGNYYCRKCGLIPLVLGLMSRKSPCAHTPSNLLKYAALYADWSDVSFQNATGMEGKGAVQIKSPGDPGSATGFPIKHC